MMTGCGRFWRLKIVCTVAVLAASELMPWGTAKAATCVDTGALGVSRTIEIDATNGPLFGGLTRNAREGSVLRPREVVLTFDDGPMPWVTRSILNTLDQHCTKATFFSVGKMAIAYPDTVRDVMARGHTLGTHTWSHPLNLRRARPDVATAEIERGFAAVAAAAGRPIAPFFRFPGLNDSGTLLTHLQQRHVATFTVDVVSNDSYIADPERLARETLAKVDAHQGGILLFHDIKVATAKALPTILAELKARGYRVVHLTSKHGFKPDPKYTSEFAAKFAQASTPGAASKRAMVPFYGTTGPVAASSETSEDARISGLGVANRADGEVTALAPEGKTFKDISARTGPVAGPVAGRVTGPVVERPRVAASKPTRRAEAPVTDGWVTTVRRSDARTTR